MPVDFGMDNPWLKGWLLLHQTYNLVSKCEDIVFSKHGITTEQHAVLMAIKYIEDPVRPTEVARWLDRNPNSISLIIDRMIKINLVKRTRDLPDRRSVRLEITGHGQKILDKASVSGWELTREILSELSDEELQTLTNLLERVRGKSFSWLNTGEELAKIRGKEAEYMADFMKRVYRYGSGSALSGNDAESREQT